MKALFDYCAEVGIQSARAYLDAGADVVAVVDPMTSQISSAISKTFVSAPLNKIFDAVRAAGGLSSLFVCGNATRNLEVMADTHCDNISVDETSICETARRLRGTENLFGGNMKLTTVLLLGTPAQAQKDAVDCYDIGSLGVGFVLAPGCDLPYAVPPANLEAVGEIVHDDYARKIARERPLELKSDDFADIVIPDYAALRQDHCRRRHARLRGLRSLRYMLSAAREAAKASSFEVEVIDTRSPAAMASAI